MCLTREEMDADAQRQAQEDADELLALQLANEVPGLPPTPTPGLHEMPAEQLDVDSMTYDELLALGERIGTVPTGLSPEELEAVTVIGPAAGRDVQDECVVCHSEYAEGENIRRLGCMHQFHKDCVDPWLARNPHCPECRTDVREPQHLVC
eukprot:NODE_209_length_1903_cov_66.043356_g185_i0.p1 GENE.NODE_209_length_1903_cov_66.043356_g185_i0~~NODE_209_length_1903_cov_66.043356_g185_i0.p1  ORF type:complete len:151 (-),score=19.68 NODE_209_length_1903_cov_66.043356_g185_i0:828-1280(-)